MADGAPRCATAQDMQRRAFDAMAQELDGVTDVALIGFPLYPNAGDALIWLAQLALLARLGIRLRAIGELEVLDPRGVDRLPKSTVVLLGGGGNFGDLWPRLQRNREQLLVAAKGRRVIQLPQSLHFDEPANVVPARAAIEAHGDVVLMWREEASHRAAQVLFPQTRSVLAPDVGWALGPQPRPAAVRQDRPILCISRTDHEGGPLRALPLPTGRHVDWRVGPWGAVERAAAWRPVRMERRTGPYLGLRLRSSLVRRAAMTNLAAAVRLIARAGVVMSDRLHAHVLCTMLGVPHVMVDSRSGKVRSSIETWSSADPLVHLAASPTEALDCALGLSVSGRRDGQ